MTTFLGRSPSFLGNKGWERSRRDSGVYGLCTESAACTKKGDAAQKVNRMLLSRLSI